MITKCKIYSNRPKVCEEYPLKEKFGAPLPRSCSYVINRDGSVDGKCNRCGECCAALYADIHNMGSRFHMGDSCPYLEIIEK